MHTQPGRDLALGLRSLPAREGLRRFCRPPKERAGVPAWSSVTSAHLSSLPSPVSDPDPSRLNRRPRSAADPLICHLGLIDVGQVGDSPLGLRPSPCMLFLPSNVLIQWGSFSSSCCLVLHAPWRSCQWSRLSGPRPLTIARIWGQLGFQCLCSSPLRLPQASICRADVSQVGASPLGLRPLSFSPFCRVFVIRAHLPGCRTG